MALWLLYRPKWPLWETAVYKTSGILSRIPSKTVVIRNTNVQNVRHIKQAFGHSVYWITGVQGPTVDCSSISILIQLIGPRGKWRFLKGRIFVVYICESFFDLLLPFKRSANILPTLKTSNLKSSTLKASIFWELVSPETWLSYFIMWIYCNKKLIIGQLFKPNLT